MRIVIAGGHGKIALQLATILAGLGHTPVSLIRNPAHADDVRAIGSTPVVIDLEQADATALALEIAGADAVVFAAGAGPGSTAERKLGVDRDGAILLADAAERAGVRRCILISAIATDDFDADSDDPFQIYLRAKSEADANLRGRDLDWTIVRPGSLTDEPGTGLVHLAERTGSGSIPRADVAALLAALLVTGSGLHRQFEAISGDQPLSDAVAAL
jgi:uncharacterized protein YbjT (DUF2867 family)